MACESLCLVIWIDLGVSKGKICFWGLLQQWAWWMVLGPPARVLLIRMGLGPQPLPLRVPDVSFKNLSL